MAVSHITGGPGIPGVENEYFHLLLTLKGGTARETAKILTDIVAGQPGVLHDGARSKRPTKVRGQNFGCSCVWVKPVRAVLIKWRNLLRMLLKFARNG